MEEQTPETTPKTIQEITAVHDLLQAVLKHPFIDIQTGKRDVEMLKQVLCWVLGHGDPAGIGQTVDALMQTLEEADFNQAEAMSPVPGEEVTVQ